MSKATMTFHETYSRDDAESSLLMRGLFEMLGVCPSTEFTFRKVLTDIHRATPLLPSSR